MSAHALVFDDIWDAIPTEWVSYSGRNCEGFKALTHEEKEALVQRYVDEQEDSFFQAYEDVFPEHYECLDGWLSQTCRCREQSTGSKETTNFSQLHNVSANIVR